MKYVFEHKDLIDYPDDVQRIVQIFADNGYELSEHDAYYAWDAYSDSMCAGWMNLGDYDEYIFATARRYLTLAD